MKHIHTLLIIVLWAGFTLFPESHAASSDPIFFYPPVISPGTPLMGSEVTFCVAVTDPNGLPVTVTYDYGDSTIDTLGRHVYLDGGTYQVKITLNNGLSTVTTTLTVTVSEFSNLWVKKETLKISTAGKLSWRAQFIYNADRTAANIFDPSKENFLGSVGALSKFELLGTTTGTSNLSGKKPKFTYKSPKGIIPAFKATIDESNQTVTINSTSDGFTDKLPGLFRNVVKVGDDSFLLDLAFNASGKFIPNAGYRSTAFVVSNATVHIGKPNKDSATFTMLLGDPSFKFPADSGNKTVQVLITNSSNQTLLSKDFTSGIISKGGHLKSGKDISKPSGAFSYDSLKGTLTFKLQKASLAGVLTTSEEHVRVSVVIGERTYSTFVTLFAAKAGSYSTKIPSKFNSFIPALVVDSTPPEVLSVLPANYATEIAIDAPISATFSEAMNPVTLNPNTFALQSGSTMIPGTIAYADNVATFTPLSPLTPGATFVAVITDGATDIAGNKLCCPYVWTFTRSVSPTVISTNPINLASNVPLNSKVAATFNKPMNPTSVMSAFSLKLAGVAIAGSVNYNGLTATFTPGALLTANSVYTARLSTLAKDDRGNPLVNDYVWTFTTSAALDTTPPRLNSTVPLNLATNVATNSKVSATFSEAMDSATLPGAFSLSLAGALVPGTMNYVGQTATFTPTTLLSANQSYTAMFTTAAKDLAGNALASNYSWSFTTAVAADTIAPTVTSTLPVNQATQIPNSSKVSAVFSEAMDAITISSAFVVKLGSTVVPGTVNYSGLTATFTPSGLLASGSLYTASISTAAKDLAGNSIAGNFEWTFTTSPAVDTTPPKVNSTVPINLATNVAINGKISAMFNEAMDMATLNTGTFTLVQGVTSIAGSVVYTTTGSAATFTPSAPLASSTVFTATISTGAKDVAGNKLASDYVWSFTTSALPDTTAPNVISTSPLNLASNVAINQSVNATFDEQIDSNTLTLASFTLEGPGSALISGTIGYDTINRIATLTPSSDLLPGTQYTATLTTDVQDLAGNALALKKVWTFTTGAQANPPPVILGAAEPFGTFGGGAGMTSQGIFTVVNGDIGTTGVSTSVTGFHDKVGDIYTETPLNQGFVNGRIYTAPPTPGGAGVGGNAVTFAIATQSALDSQKAYDSISPASKPGGMDPGAGQLGGLTLAPGIYKAAGDTFQITGSDLTLDAQGDTNAVWIFQMAASLTVGSPGAPRSIIMVNGAQPKNVFWYVGSSATINAAGGGTMVGTIIASAGVTFSTAGNVTVVTLNGRALSLNASTTLVNTVINVPAK